jgi:hypothetical protein
MPQPCLPYPKLRHPLATNNVEERTRARRSRREPVAPTAEHLLVDRSFPSRHVRGLVDLQFLDVGSGSIWEHDEELMDGLLLFSSP